VNSDLDNSSAAKGAIDEQLLPYLNASGSDAQHQLDRLFEKARPIVYRIARSVRLGASQSANYFNTQDIYADVCIRLLPILQEFKKDSQRYPITNFAGLVATATSSVFADLLKVQDRQKRNLRQKIRRLIAANAELSIWNDDKGRAICGYASWRTDNEPASPIVRVPSQMALGFSSDETHKRNTAELILHCLSNAGRPIKLDELVDLVNIASEGVEVQTVSIDDQFYIQSSSLISYQPDLVAGVENQRLLNRLFEEIGTLRVEQRKSLLLNMTDSYGFGIEWFLFTKIATEEHLARLLEVSIDQFRSMLNDLPMSDADIARDLGISQSKVANMRRAVRERLDRRRRAFFGDSSNDSVRMK
jgi:RNA polymerase sigma factor (sigma-70 family)